MEYDEESLQKELLGACRDGKVDKVVKVISSGCNIHNWKQGSSSSLSTGDTPLHVACEHGQLDVAKLLVETFGCDPKLPGPQIDRDTPLHSACRGGHVNVVKLLVDTYGCSPVGSRNNKWGETPLHTACSHRRTKIVKLLIDAYACNPTTKNNRGYTSLHLSCMHGHVDTVKLLIERCGVDVTSYDYGGNTPLHLACLTGKLGIVKLLMSLRTQYPPLPPHLVPDSEKKNNDGMTLLLVACHNKRWNIANYLLTECHCDASVTDGRQNTPLHYACLSGHLETVTLLTTQSDCDVNAINQWGDTPLHTACVKGHLDIVKLLMSLRTQQPPLPPHRVPDPEKKNNEGMNPLLVACQNKRWSIANYLLSECHCNASVADKGRDTPLHYACQLAQLETVALLTTQSDCDVNAINWWGDTPLHIACEEGHVDIVKVLMSLRTRWPSLPPHRVPAFEKKNKAEMTPLLLACHSGKYSLETAKLLLQHGCNPNQENLSRMTPLDTAYRVPLIKELLRHGAKPTPLYERYSKIFSASAHEQPPESQVKIFIMGSPGVGKSTLTEALKQEGPGLIHSLTGRLQNVSGVDQKTAGIVPHDFRSQKYGCVTFYDFAGQKEFYAAHSAVLQNVISSSTPVFVIVTDLRESEEDLKQQLLYWLSFLENQYTIEDMKPHVIVVGSHADSVKPSHKLQALESVLRSPQFSFSFHLAGLVAMDCRKTKSPAMTTLRRCLRESCTILREQSTIDFQCHCLLVCLAEFFPTSLAFQLGDILTSATSKRSRSLRSVVKFLPHSAIELCTLLEQLNDHGHILLLKNTVIVESSWVILDKQALLSRVTGTVFAPEGFKQHCDLASSTGVVPYSKIAQHFPEHNPDMIVGFLSHLEFCREISDQEVLQLISEKHHPNTDCTDGQFLFFPSLIRIESPSGVWEADPRFHYHCGWMLQCQPNQFFTPRFLQVLLLRLAFSLALAKDDTQVRHDIPSLQRKCKIWTNGICWTNRKGVETLVEVDILYTKLSLMMRCSRGAEMECVHLRSTIIGRALQAKKDFCPKVPTNEFVLPLSQVASYPRRTDVPSILISLTEVARAILEPAPFVLDNAEKAWHLEDDLLYFEPYAGLGRDFVCELFDDENPNYCEEVSDDFLFGIANRVYHNFDHFKKMLNISPITFENYLSLCPPVTGEAQKMGRFLCCWKEHSEGSRQCLHGKLDEFSVFTGRNPLDFARASS